MTVPTTSNKVIGTGNGVSTVFPFTFGTLTSGDLVVSLFGPDKVEIPQTEGINYSVQGEGDEDGGSVTFVVPPPNQYTVLIQRILPLTQPTDYKNQGSFYPRTHERSFDRITMIAQQLGERIDAAFKLPPEVTGVSTTMPAPVSNGIWGWDVTATTPRYFSVGEIATAAIAQNWKFATFPGDGIAAQFILPDDPGSIANMDISIDGVTQVPVADYTNLGAVLTFSTPPADGSVVLVRYGTALAQGIGATFQPIQVNVTAGQTIVAIPSIASGAIQQVYVDGIFQSPSAYTLLGHVITFSEPLPSDGVVVAIVSDGAYSGAVSAAEISYTASFTGAISRSMRSRLDDIVTAEDFGTVGDGATDDTNALQAAFAHLSLRGGRLIISKPHVVSSSISPGNFTADATIEFANGGKLIAAAGMTTPVMNLFASATAPTDRRILFINPHVDVSLGSSPIVGGQFCSGLALTYFGDVRIEGGFFYGGETPDNLNGDSGLTTVGCTNLQVDGARFRGFNDCGAYINGDATAVPGVGDGRYAVFSDCIWERCSNALNSKRDLAHVQIIGGFVTECGSGFTCVEIAAPFLNPGRRMDVIGTRFKKVTANCVRFRGPAIGTVKNCVFEDWGRTYDGVSSVGANAYAIVLEGSAGLELCSNEFSRVDWALDDQRAYRLNNLTLNAVPYTQGKNVFSGNTYRNIARIVVQSAAGNPNFFVDELYDTISNTKFNSLDTQTIVQYREVGSQQEFLLLNGVTYPLAPRELLDVPAGATLTAADSGKTYTNAGAAAISVFNLPGAVKGMEFGFYSMDTDGVRVVAAAGDIIRIAGSASTSGGNASNVQVGTHLRLRALDNTNWIAESSLGTWTLA